MDCDICCQRINNATRKEVGCPYCNRIACLKCFRRYLLESIGAIPVCMFCYHELSLDFISEMTPKNFHQRQFRDKRAADLLSRERSLLPDTQYLVEHELEKQRRAVVIKELKEELIYLRFRRREIDREIRSLRYTPLNKEKIRKKFIMGCPAGDCRGFLSQAWKCGTCERYVCPECRIIKANRDDPNHICNENDVATAKLLARDTKPCPKCAAPIFKISGCDQMWCVECQTPFSWGTGKIETGRIHNPHFYQFQRNQNGGVAPRVPEDIRRCGGLPWIGTLQHIFRTRGCAFPKWRMCHRLIEHIRQIILPNFPAIVGMQDNTDLRLQFLLKEINDKKWLRILKMRQKASEKNRSVNQILTMFITVMTDLFLTFATGATKDLGMEAHALRKYVNTELDRLRTRYNNCIPHISKDWKIKNTK